MGWKERAAKAEEETLPEVIVSTQHFVSATTIMVSVPDQTYNKLLRIIADRWPGKTFRIQTMNTFPSGNGYTINVLIEEI